MTDAQTRAHRQATHAALLAAAGYHAEAAMRPELHLGRRLVLAIEAAELVRVADAIREQIAADTAHDD